MNYGLTRVKRDRVVGTTLTERDQRALLAGYRSMLNTAIEVLKFIVEECQSKDEMERAAHEGLDQVGEEAN